MNSSYSVPHCLSLHVRFCTLRTFPCQLPPTVTHDNIFSALTRQSLQLAKRQKHAASFLQTSNLNSRSHSGMRNYKMTQMRYADSWCEVNWRDLKQMVVDSESHFYQTSALIMQHSAHTGSRSPVCGPAGLQRLCVPVEHGHSIIHTLSYYCYKMITHDGR